MKINPDYNAAATAATFAGPAGSEALTGALDLLKTILLDEATAKEDHPEWFPYGIADCDMQMATDLLRQAYAVVENGHIHIGLINSQAVMFITRLFDTAKEVTVVAECAGAMIEIPLMGSDPLIIVSDDKIAWDFVAEPPSTIKRASIYFVEHGQFQMVATRPVRGCWYGEDRT